MLEAVITELRPEEKKPALRGERGRVLTQKKQPIEKDPEAQRALCGVGGGAGVLVRTKESIRSAMWQGAEDMGLPDRLQRRI